MTLTTPIGIIGQIGILTLATFADNGVVSAYFVSDYGLSLYRYSYDSVNLLFTILAAMVIAPVAYMFLIWLVLRFTRRRVIRQGALPSS
jgi:hypothetical protein